MSFVGWLVSIIYKSLFLTGDEGYREAHFLSKLAFASAILLSIIRVPERAVILPPVIIPLGLLSPRRDWIVASTALSSLAGIYLSVSAYLLSLTGLYHMTPLQILEVACRVVGISISLIFVFVMTSPIEVHNIIYMLTGRRICAYPLLLWRLVPLGLKNFIDSLSVGKLKGEGVTKRVPPAVASMIEITRFMEEYCYWRLKLGPKCPLKLNRSAKYTLALTLGSIVVAVATSTSL